MKLLTIYYSRTGNTRKLADSIAKILDSDILEIISKKERKGPLGFLRSGKEAFKNELPEIKVADVNFQDYDLILIGTPIWVGTMASPIRTFISQNKDSFSHVAFFCTSGGNNYGKLFESMTKFFGREPVATYGIRAKDLDDAISDENLADFISKVKELGK